MHEWDHVLAALQTGPADAEQLLAALRTPELAHRFAHVWPDTLADAAWPRHGPWHLPSAPVALLHRAGCDVICGPAVTTLGLDVVARGAVYANMHDRYAVRAARSLADWAAHNRRRSAAGHR